MTANEKFQALLEAGIYKGGADGTFDPDGQMTREQFAAIMARLLGVHGVGTRSEEHTSELQSLMRISYAVFCLKNKNKPNTDTQELHTSEQPQNNHISMT